MHKSLLKWAIAASLMALSGVPSGSAQEIDLGGVWEADNGESRYELEFCGNGRQLCATLTWIRPDVISDRNRPYIGSYVVKEARLAWTDPPTWKGKINIYGNEVNGQVVLVQPDRFEVQGCALIFFCETTGANRVADSAN